jgi:anti-anti-sigma regulatory factor
MDLSADFCRIAVVGIEDGIMIRVEGDVDFASAPSLDAAFADVDGSGVVEIDVGGMTFCDGAGLRVLDLAHRRLGPRLVVTGASPLLRRLAAVLDMDWLAAAASDRSVGAGNTPR